jgi:hypothetical protein
MSYFGEYRGRRKALASIRLLPNGAGMATLYKDGVMQGLANSVSYTTGAWTQLFTAAQGIATVNMIELFDSTGNSAQLGLGESGSEVDLILIVPGGNGDIAIRIDSGIRIAIKPNDYVPTLGSEVLINFYD